MCGTWTDFQDIMRGHAITSQAIAARHLGDHEVSPRADAAITLGRFPGTSPYLSAVNHSDASMALPEDRRYGDQN
jgi:hypothetical protein